MDDPFARQGGGGGGYNNPSSYGQQQHPGNNPGWNTAPPVTAPQNGGWQQPQPPQRQVQQQVSPQHYPQQQNIPYNHNQPQQSPPPPPSSSLYPSLNNGFQQQPQQQFYAGNGQQYPPPAPQTRTPSGEYQRNSYEQQQPLLYPQQQNTGFYNPQQYPPAPNNNNIPQQYKNTQSSSDPNQPYLNMFNNLQSNPAAQLGLQFGSNALAQGQEMVNQNINKYVSVGQIKYYFNVSNSYVLDKLRLLLFSFRQKQWTRMVNRSMQNGQMEGYKYPRDDINAPDLYIPVMAFVTYVLLTGILLGRDQRFKPDVLGMTSTTGIFFVCAEVLFIKLGCYLLSVTTDVPFLDLFAYCGYKFVPIVVTLVIKILSPGMTLLYSFFLFFMLSYGFYTLRTLKYLVLPENAGATVVTHGRKRRTHFLLLIALVQILVSWLLI